MGLIDAMVYKLWSWMSTHATAYAAHIANASAHHTKYTDAEVDAIVLTHKNLASAHHTKYTDAEAVTAMGAKGDANPLHHDKQIGRGFSSYLANNQSIAKETYVTVIFNGEYFDGENEYNITDGKYTPQVAGYYIVTGGVMYDVLPDGKKFIVQIRKNTSVVSVNRATVGGSDYVGGSCASVVYMNGSTDYLSVDTYHNNGIGLNILANKCFFGSWMLPAP